MWELASVSGVQGSIIALFEVGFGLVENTGIRLCKGQILLDEFGIRE